jgi:hypothetical protein
MRTLCALVTFTVASLHRFLKRSKSSEQGDQIGRLGEVSPFGWLFTLGIFENCRSRSNYWAMCLLISTLKIFVCFGRVGPRFGPFFANASGCTGCEWFSSSQAFDVFFPLRTNSPSITNSTGAPTVDDEWVSGIKWRKTGLNFFFGLFFMEI